MREAPAAMTLLPNVSRILPGATIGMLGSGQLGRMFTQAAQRMGYHVHVFSTHQDSPTGQVADKESIGSYDDLQAVAAFANDVDVVTLEFENVPIAVVEEAGRHAPVRPSSSVLQTVQHRLREKRFLRDNGIACARFRAVRSQDELKMAVEEIGCPAVLKTAAEGYDGKGQRRITSGAMVNNVWKQLGQRECVLEDFIEFDQELSVIATRGPDGSIVTCGPIANWHENHILDVSVMPHPDLEDVEDESAEIARIIADQLDVVGVICVEFFLTTDGELLVNEIAPRPHNSGHMTIEACLTSQFEQQVRAVCGLPLGEATQTHHAAMANLLGHLWAQGEPHWEGVLDMPGIKLHLYGKHEARPGRKMGHLTALANSPEEAEAMVREGRDRLVEST